jgi:ribosomal-protein-alanine N-acetyltransferase
VKIQIRKMMLSDVDDIYAIEKSLFDFPWKRNFFVDEIENNINAINDVLLIEEKIVGYSINWKIVDEIHIGNIAIHKKFQRQGLAEKLINHLFKNLKDIVVCHLEVDVNNIPAITLYRKLGFESLSIRKKYYENGADALLMIKKIKES